MDRKMKFLPKETKLIKRMVRGGKTMKDIVNAFPNRSENVVRCKLYRMGYKFNYNGGVREGL
jgi:hypothetical protein